VNTASADRDACLVVGARVIDVDDNNRLRLEFDSPELCAGCEGTCLWRRLRSERLGPIVVSRPMLPGQSVTVRVSAAWLSYAALVLYGVPLALILVGAGAGQVIIGADPGGVLGAVAGLLAYVFIARFMRRKLDAATLTYLVVEPRT
jgi:positive regulator of sigma E activity